MFVDIHTHRKTSDSFSLFNAFEQETTIPCSYGIHPWYVEAINEERFLKLEQLIQQENCFAVGECGLDKLADTAWDLQLMVFERHIHFSEKFQKPLLIHCVKATQEIILLKRKYQPKQAWIFHAFRKTNTLPQLLQEGFFISIGTALLKDAKLQKSSTTIPLERLFFETDGKDFSIQQVYEKAAALRQLKVNVLEKQIEMNFGRLFR